MAVRPPVIKLYSQGDYQRMIEMAMNTTRYCLFINTLLVLPIVSNIDFILKIWLKNVPDYTAIFIQILLIESYFNIMNQMITILVNATGKLKRNQFYGRTYTLAVLPVAYLMLHIIESPTIPMIMVVVGTVLYFLNNLYDVHLQLGVDMCAYLRKVIIPVFIINVIIGVIIIGVKSLFFQGWLLLFSTCFVTVFFGCPLVFKMFLTKEEQSFITAKLKRSSK